MEEAAGGAGDGTGWCLAMLPVFAVVTATPPDGWATCGGLAPALEHTACPTANATCCQQKWSPSEGTWGCMPMAGATCCANGYTACPANTRCVDSGADWRVVGACVPATAEHDGADTTGWAACKQGPPPPMSTTRRNGPVRGGPGSTGLPPFVN